MSDYTEQEKIDESEIGRAMELLLGIPDRRKLEFEIGNVFEEMGFVTNRAAHNGVSFWRSTFYANGDPTIFWVCRNLDELFTCEDCYGPDFDLILTLTKVPSLAIFSSPPQAKLLAAAAKERARSNKTCNNEQDGWKEIVMNTTDTKGFWWRERPQEYLAKIFGYKPENK